MLFGAAEFSHDSDFAVLCEPQTEIYFSVMSLDETVIAIPLPSRKVWQVHDVRSGRLLRTLPLMPDVVTGAFSPDNSTLYSVADGVLYRQLAR